MIMICGPLELILARMRGEKTHNTVIIHDTTQRFITEICVSGELYEGLTLSKLTILALARWWQAPDQYTQRLLLAAFPPIVFLI